MLCDLLIGLLVLQGMRLPTPGGDAAEVMLVVGRNVGIPVEVLVSVAFYSY